MSAAPRPPQETKAYAPSKPILCMESTCLHYGKMSACYVPLIERPAEGCFCSRDSDVARRLARLLNEDGLVS